MIGGRKVIAIEGGIEGEEPEAGTVRLGKLLAADPELGETPAALPVSTSNDGTDGGWAIGTAPAATAEAWSETTDEAAEPAPESAANGSV